MSTLKTAQCVIVDDEPIARRIIRNHLSKVAGYAVAGECSNALACFSLLQTHAVDLLLLDIQMPQLSGLEFLRSLQHRPKVIITTAHREWAVEGFELDVVDYLLKPISFERFLRALDKFRQKQQHQVVRESSPDKSTEEPAHLLIRADRKTVKLDLAEVLYIESMSDYLKIYTREGLLFTKEKISIFEQKLPSCFLRIHRSFIINLKHLQAFTHETTELGGQQLPISRSFRHEVMARLNGL